MPNLALPETIVWTAAANQACAMLMPLHYTFWESFLSPRLELAAISLHRQNLSISSYIVAVEYIQ